MKTHYELLGVERGAPAEEIKRAFRREIARYHPDKVQHLGAEFQEIAAMRAAELTEAYRVLMDAGEREKYDAALAAPAQRPAYSPAPAAHAAPAAAPAQAPHAAGVHARHVERPRRATDLFVTKAALRMLDEAVSDVVPAAEPISVRGFDAGYALKSKRSLFGKVKPDIAMLARFVGHVDPAAVEESWGLGRAAAIDSEPVCLLVMGGGLAPSGELAVAVAEQRRKTRTRQLLLVPVDVRDWEALLPPDTPAPVRAVLQRLRDGRR